MRAVCITVCDPFRPMHNRVVVQLRRRRSIRALAPRTVQPVVAILNGKPILRAAWRRRVAEGDALAFVVLPQGGGGGSNPLAIVALIALAVVSGGAAFALYGAMGGAMGAAAFAASALGSAMTMGVMMAGSMLINALLPPPRLGASGSTAALAAASPTYALQAQGNSARLDAPIPVLYGRHRVYPDFASNPYAEYSGNDQYLYQLFCVTQGLAEVNEIRISDAVLDAAPINDNEVHVAGGAYADVSYQIIPPGGSVTLFPSRVTTSSEVSGQEALTGIAIGPFPASPAGVVCNSIAIDLAFPRGLYYANDNGSLGSKTIQWVVEAAPINDAGSIVGAWITLSADTVYSEWSAWADVAYAVALPADTDTQQWQNITVGDWDGDGTVITQTRTRIATTGINAFTAATSTPQRQTYRYTVPPGRYAVRLTRTDAKDPSSRAAHEMDWVGLRAYIPGNQSYGDVTLIALRMRATNQLSSASARKINVIAQRHLPVWTGSAWVVQATRSIAWAFADAARNTNYGAKLPDVRLDLAGLLALDAEWSSRGDYYDGIFDTLGTCWEALTQVARAGRAMPVYQGGILYAVRDQEQVLPVALFTPRNIVRGSLKLDYTLVTDDTCDGVEVSYYDGDVWSWQTVACQLAGDTYLQPAKVKLPGVVSRAQAWREGMYMAACNRYRRRFGSHQTEMEGLIPRVGDLIAISHDMPAWGASGEVVDRSGMDVGHTLTLSEPVVGSGDRYIALSAIDGSVSGPWRVVAVDGSPVVTLVEAIPGFAWPDPCMQERPRYALGASSSTAMLRARVLSIRPSSSERIDISWVVESESVHLADAAAEGAPLRPDWQLPGQPTIPVVTQLSLKTTPGEPTKIILTWRAAAGADTYIVQQSVDGVSWAQSGEVRGTAWTGVAMCIAGARFRVAGVGQVAVGPWSAVVVAPDVVTLPTPISPTIWATPDSSGHVSRAKVRVEFAQPITQPVTGMAFFVSATPFENAVAVASGGTSDALVLANLATLNSGTLPVLAGSTTTKIETTTLAAPNDVSWNSGGRYWARLPTSEWSKCTGIDATGYYFAPPFNVPPLPGDELLWAEIAWADERSGQYQMAILSDGNAYETIRWTTLDDNGPAGAIRVTGCERGVDGTSVLNADGLTLHYLPAPGPGTSVIDFPASAFVMNGDTYVAEINIDINVPAGNFVSISSAIYYKYESGGFARSKIVPAIYGGPL